MVISLLYCRCLPPLNVRFEHAILLNRKTFRLKAHRNALDMVPRRPLIFVEYSSHKRYN